MRNWSDPGPVVQLRLSQPISTVTISASVPPIAPPSRPSLRNRPWNSRAMKASSAPTRCSTSTESWLPAIAPRVANATASAAASVMSRTTATPARIIVRAMADSRPAQRR